MITIKNAETIQQCHSIHQLFNSFSPVKNIIFIFGLSLWAIIPLLGTVFILIYCQINISAERIKGNKKLVLNLFPILIVLFTITTYIASFDPFSDTKVYLNIYNSLINDSGFIIPDIEYEPVSFILPKYLSQLTGGDQLSFLYFQSLTMNTAFTIIPIIFIPDFFPLIILINVMTSGYYFQLFWMRQIYSFIFILPIVYIDSLLLSSLFLYTAFLTHSSAIMFVLVPLAGVLQTRLSSLLSFLRLILKKIYKVINPKIFMLILAGLIILLSSQLTGFSLSFIKQLLPYSKVSDKIDRYSGDQDFNIAQFSLASQMLTLLDYFTILFFIVNTDLNKINKTFFRLVVFFFIVLIVYISAFSLGFNLRIASIFFCVPGFFYTIVLSYGKLKDGFNLYTMVFILTVVIRILYFFYGLVKTYKGESYLTFWNGEALLTPITEYFHLFYQFIVEGILS